MELWFHVMYGDGVMWLICGMNYGRPTNKCTNNTSTWTTWKILVWEILANYRSCQLHMTLISFSWLHSRRALRLELTNQDGKVRYGSRWVNLSFAVSWCAHHFLKMSTDILTEMPFSTNQSMTMAKATEKSQLR